MKKLLCAFLAFAIVMSLNITSFAAVKKVTSVSFSEDTVHAIEHYDGTWTYDENGEEYYDYALWSLVCQEGNMITVNYNDGSYDEYIAGEVTLIDEYGDEYQDFDFYNFEKECLDWTIVLDVEQAVEHWTVGNEYTLYVQVGSKNCPVNVVVDETPVESAVYIPVSEKAIPVNTNGFVAGDIDFNTWEIVLFYYYSEYDFITEGDKIVVTYKDSTVTEFTANTYTDTEYEEDEDGKIVEVEYEFIVFEDELGNELPADEINSDQMPDAPWSVGEHSIFINVLGYPVEFTVELVEGSNWFYDDEEGFWYYIVDGCVTTGWEKISGKWYYFNEFGEMQTGWQQIDNKWYYFNKSGAMQTGWLKSGGKWYYLTNSGAMATGWQKISNKWYYFDSKGAMQKGWAKVKSSWYYLGSDGAMRTGWQKISGKWYYFESSGKMRTAKLTYKGKVYKFSSSGVCLNP